MLISIVVEHSALACSEAAEDTASTLIIVTTDNRGLPRLSLFPFSSKLIICWLSCHASSMEFLEAVSTVISSKNRFIFHLDDAFLALQLVDFSSPQLWYYPRHCASNGPIIHQIHRKSLYNSMILLLLPPPIFLHAAVNIDSSTSITHYWCTHRVWGKSVPRRKAEK